MPIISVIIPVHNKWELTHKCLQSLAGHSPAGKLEVIVVDNASTDETGTQLPALGEKLFPQNFYYLRQNENINFGPACNLGARHASADILFFLNNDTILAENWLPPLLEALAEPGVAGVGPLLLYPNNTVQHLGVRIPPLADKVGHLYSRLPASHPLAQKTRKFPVITAAAFMLPKKLFFDVGEFFPGFINGFEDIDLCLRLVAQGLFFRVIPQSIVYHLESQTPSRKDKDSDNGTLLASRQNLRNFANAEEIAQADGYVLDIDPVLNVLFKPAPERLPALFSSMRTGGRMTGELNAAKAFDTLQNEPFWEEGHLLLAQWLDKKGETTAACDICYLSLELNPGFRAANALMAYLHKLPATPYKADMLSRLDPLYGQYREILDNKPYLAAKVRFAVEHLESIGNNALAEQYRTARDEAAEIRLSLPTR